jgi:cell division septum initiation protein DivIVA
MGDTIRLLEELVDRAVDRLRTVTEERERLQQEVDALRLRLQETQATPRGEGDRRPEVDSWPAERNQVLSALHETLLCLRGEEPPSV